MTEQSPTVLLVGEVFVDVTITPRGEENKLRLGGIVHAARGLWSHGVPFATALVVPPYLEKSAIDYLATFGCQRSIVLGRIIGAPNVILVFDATEIDNQEYEELLRDEKSIALEEGIGPDDFASFTDALVFPGKYDLREICRKLPNSIKLHIDVAYDVQNADDLLSLPQKTSSIFLSTSSELFTKIATDGFQATIGHFKALSPQALILKENRGGCRLHTYSDNKTEEIPAQLGTTVNSVGVGDVFDASYVANLARGGPSEAAWRASLTSSAYAQTTEPDTLQTYVRRDMKLPLPQLRDLGGTSLPWESRSEFAIYLAAPDFSNVDRRAIDRAISALKYHNFAVRRPVIENGELPPNSDRIDVAATYQKDVELLNASSLVFAIPTGRDPGTLVEIGIAISNSIPVVVYDPDNECANTMVIGGSDCYSQDLDACLNATFECLSTLRAKRL